MVSALAEQDSNEFVFTDSEFAQFQAFIFEQTGIRMSDQKRQLIYRRLVGRLRAYGMSSFSEYLAMLRSGEASELEIFRNSVTTNLTSFFREKHHFDFLSETVVPEIIEKSRLGPKRLRVWSAGCSTGEEPYCLAMTLREAMPDIDSWDAKILCTDLDSDVLETAKAGQYTAERLEKVPPELLNRWYKPVQVDGNKTMMQADPDLQKLITFRQLNLMHQFPMKGPFDVIFCRNVLIYFDKATQRPLIEKYAELLDVGNYLILGHSESLHDVSDRFELIGKTIYKKKR